MYSNKLNEKETCNDNQKDLRKKNLDIAVSIRFYYYFLCTQNMNEFYDVAVGLTNVSIGFKFLHISNLLLLSCLTLFLT